MTRRLRKKIKHFLYGKCPWLRGAFPYFNTTIYFPPDCLLFDAVCEQGIYELDNLSVLWALVRPETWYFDVGANLGFMSAPILRHREHSHVVSFEPSPNALPFLKRTIQASPFRARWHLVDKAVGSTAGRIDFALSSERCSAFEGTRFTGRAPQGRTVTVEQTTLDQAWEGLGSPKVSAMKIDVEGAEREVLLGAQKFIAGCSPFILLEWNGANLHAHEVEPGELIGLAERLNYDLFSLPHLIPVETAVALRLHMIRTESFLLAPRRARATAAP